MRNLFVIIFFHLPFLLMAQAPDSVLSKQVDSLIQRSQVHTSKRDYVQALVDNSIADSISLKHFGRESEFYGRCCMNRARIYLQMRNFTDSEKWFFEARDIIGKTLGNQNRDYAVILTNLGIMYNEMGQHTKAEELFLEALVIWESTVGKESPYYASSLNALAFLYQKIGQFNKAEKAALEVLGIRGKVLGKDNQDYAGSLINLAGIYQILGQYEKAEQLLSEAKYIFEVRLKNRTHPFYMFCLNVLATVFALTDQYAKAEPLFLEAKEIMAKTLGMDHPEYAKCLNGLSILYQDFGNYAKAEPLLLEVKEIEAKTLGKEDSEYAKCLHNLGNLYLKFGNFEKAEINYLEARSIWEKAIGKEHPHYALCLNNLAAVYRELGNYEKAELFLFESINIRKNLLGNMHPDYAQSLISLGNLYRLQGNYAKAEPFYLEAKSILENTLGKEHANYAQVLLNLAKIREKQMHFADSEPMLQEAYTLTQNRLVTAASYLSEKELTLYTFLFQRHLDDLMSILLSRSFIGEDFGKLADLSYDQVLFYKGFLLNAAARLSATWISSPEINEIRLQLKSYRRLLAAEYAKPISGRKGIDELEEKANVAEKKLARSLLGYAQDTRQVKWRDIQEVLKPAEAAIEFVSFKYSFHNQPDSVVYAALLLKSDNKSPRFIYLFDEKSLDSLLQYKSDRRADYVNSLYRHSMRGLIENDAPKKSLYEIIWKPLEKELDGIQAVYFSPSGLLHRINIDAIPYSETQVLADRYQLYELSSTRQLMARSDTDFTGNQALLYGGIQFEEDTAVDNTSPVIASRSRGEFSFSMVDSVMRGGNWDYLAGTEREVLSIEKLLRTAGIQVSLNRGQIATEESFKNIGVSTASPRIIHFATHGYFFPDIQGDYRSSKGTEPAQEPVFKLSDHPMLRSGLILAGGNAAWQGKETAVGRDDGILTAYEISQMNLSNTELVVLSACETGLGEIQGNEGVYGLQRAFKIAGAKYLIMSLWQVPDKQTSLLMTTFYKKWLEAEDPDKRGEKMTIPDAFHAAQKELRDMGFDPYQWAGFVLVE